MKQRRICLRAYLCNNLGDDLFVKNIAVRYPNVDFYLDCLEKYRYGFKSHSNIKFYPKFAKTVDRFANKVVHKKIVADLIAKRSDAFVQIGGSIFIEPKNFKKSRYILPNKNAFTIGANFGPYKTGAFFEYSYDRISKMKDTCFRDSFSYNLFKNMDNVRVAPDVLFGYPLYPKTCLGNGIGISLISLEARNGLQNMSERYYGAISELITLCQGKGIPVKLFGFCADEGDEKAIQEVVFRLKDQNVERYNYNGNAEEFLNEFNSCEYIIATRFHAMIIGWRLGKKVFPIIYSNKQKNVIDDVEFSGNCWNLLEDSVCDGNMLFDGCLSNCELNNIEYYINKSQEQFRKLDKFLKRM